MLPQQSHVKYKCIGYLKNLYFTYFIKQAVNPADFFHTGNLSANLTGLKSYATKVGFL